MSAADHLKNIRERVETERILRDGDPFYAINGHLPDGTPLHECSTWELIGLDATSRLLDALERVLEVHKQDDDMPLFCRACDDYWPCPTVAAINDALEGK